MLDIIKSLDDSTWKKDTWQKLESNPGLTLEADTLPLGQV